MIARTLLSALAAAPLLAFAAPTDALITLARQYAPQLRFEVNEKYFASSVEYFLGGPLTPQDASGKPVGGSVSPSNNSLPNAGAGLFLNTPVDSASLAGFLAGQKQGAKIYTFAASKPNGVVDLYYWLFTPFNLGKSVPLLGQVGDHVGDWERLKVRTVNGAATQVEYHAHGDTGSGTIPWDQVVKFDNNQRPVGYVASGSHGFWATAGSFTYVNAVIFQLKDITSDNGVAWDTRDDLVVLNYPDSYSGEQSWLNYKGAWGTQGKTDCWWHFIYSECQLVDAPTGPLRDDVLSASFAKTTGLSDNTNMNTPSSHTLATVSDADSSTYGIYVQGVESGGFVGISQTCTAGSDGNAGHAVKHLEQTADGSFVKRADEPTDEYTYAVVHAPTTGDHVRLTVAACPEGSAITGYSAAPCATADADSCAFEVTRAIRAYTSGVAGVQAARAIEVEDLDFWSF